MMITHSTYLQTQSSTAEHLRTDLSNIIIYIVSNIIIYIVSLILAKQKTPFRNICTGKAFQNRRVWKEIVSMA